MADIGTPLDEGFDLLPDATEPPAADDALTLEDALAEPAELDVQQDPPVSLGRAPAIDFVQRRFVPSTAGGPLMVYGLDTLAQWVEKCLRTRRGENPACNPDFGLDRLFTDLIDGGPFDAGAAAEFESICERALTTHPAIDSIEDWNVDYEPNDDAAAATFRVVPALDGFDPLDLSVAIPTGA